MQKVHAFSAARKRLNGMSHGGVMQWMITELGEVVSTATLAKERIQRGDAVHGEVLQAQHQTGGRGRMAGRQWLDEPGASLLMNVTLLELSVPVEVLQVFTALAVLDAVRALGSAQTGGVDVRLKLPNDLLALDGRKLCGILTEVVWRGSRFAGATLGIGMNVRQSNFDGPLARHALSLRMLGIDLDVATARGHILASVERSLRLVADLEPAVAQAQILARAEREDAACAPWLRAVNGDDTAAARERAADLEHFQQLRHHGTPRS